MRLQILKGSLTETLYAWPSKAVQENLDTEALQTTKESCYQENDVAYSKRTSYLVIVVFRSRR